MKKNYSLSDASQKERRFFLKPTLLMCGVFLFSGAISAQIQNVNTFNSPYSKIKANSAPVVWDRSIALTLNKTDSLINVANSLTEADYTVPSWTLLRRAVTTASSLEDSISTVALQVALDSLKSREMPYNINMTLRNDPKSNLGFAWFTNADVTGGKVEIVQGNVADSSAFAKPDFTFNAVCTPVVNLNYCDSANNLSKLAGIPDNTKKSYTANKALATGLTSNTSYSYRVGKPGAWSETGTFTTAKNTTDEFSFIFTTDPQADTDPGLYSSQTGTHTAQNMYPSANFWLNGGDLAESYSPANSEWEYEQLFQTQQDIFLKKPWTVVLGNHDFSMNKNFTYHFNTDSIGFDYALSTVPGCFSSFVYGNALFLGMAFDNYDSPGYLDSISNWMRRQVAITPSTKWRIAFFHLPIYTGASHQVDWELKVIRDAMAPVFDELKIDLALQGHDHIYEVIGPVYNKQLVANAVSNLDSVGYNRWTNVTGKSAGIFNVKKGTLYFSNGHAGLKEYTPNIQAVMDSIEAGLGMTNYYGLFTGRFGQTNNPSFSYITVSTDTINIKTYAVSDLNVASLYDNIKVVKSTTALSQVDSLINVANSLVEADYTVPSWTLLRRAATTASSLKDAASTVALQATLDSLKSREMPYNINMTLRNDPKSNLGFAWFTNTGVTGGKVEIVQGNAADSSVFATPDFTFNTVCTPVVNINYCDSMNNLSQLAGIPDNAKRSYTANKALATGLTPNTSYSYRVGKPGAWSEIGTFTTAKNTTDPFSFIYTTDNQESNDRVVTATQTAAHTAQDLYPTANFWLNSGNLAESSGTNNSEWEYEQFFQTQQDIFLKKPGAMLAGNHDISTNKNFTRHFNTDSIGFDYAQSTVPGSFYSFVYGDALFMGMSFDNYNTPGYLDSISNWMRRQVAANPDPKWRIVSFHRTIYTGAQHQVDEDGIALREAIAPVIDELKIDLALQGHDHIYEVIGPVYNKQLVANAVSNQDSAGYNKWTNVSRKSGGTFNVQKGTLYFLNGKFGEKEYAPNNQAVMDSIETGLGMTNYFGLFTGRFGQTNNPSFSYITVSPDTINIKTYIVKGLNVVSLYDNIKIVKIKDVLSKVDSLVHIGNSLIEKEYAVPSWTLLRKAVTTASSSKDSVSTVALQLALDSLKSKEMPYNINMTLNKDPKTKLGFAWFTNVGVTGGKVEIVQGNVADSSAFRTPDFSFNARCDSVKNLNYSVSANNLNQLAGIPDNTLKSYTANKALATGLTPNTTYSYRVGKPGAWSAIGTFTTAKNTADPFSFIYITDNEGLTDAGLDANQKTTHTAQNMYPDAGFWLNCGNLVGSSGSQNSEWEYEQFFETQQNILLKKPWVSVTGDLDISTNRNFTQHFNTDSIGFDYAMSTVPGSFYSYVYGDALFMALSFENYDSPGYLDSISNWMRRQVAANPATRWRITFFHKPIYTGATHQGDADGKIIRDAMAPVFDELKIDLTLQGDDHVYEAIGPVYNKQLVENAVLNQLPVAADPMTNVTGKLGGTFNVQKGTLYFLNGKVGEKESAPNSQAIMESMESGLGMTNYFGMFTGRFGQTNNPSFSYITVSSDTISVKTYIVSDLNVASLYDNFKVVKFTDIGTGNISTDGQNGISIYPVPVRDYAYIHLQKAVEATVEVYSSKGILLKTKFINGSTAINLQGLAKDVYILKVRSIAGNYLVKFVKE
ncbi:MAG: fibronectin type III domain-containing protein [Bacteroidota bacterium]|nr:fibronectin type III domain-containing protein [Bacteroidota bacterium]